MVHVGDIETVSVDNRLFHRGLPLATDQIVSDCSVATHRFRVELVESTLSPANGLDPQVCSTDSLSPHICSISTLSLKPSDNVTTHSVPTANTANTS